MKTATKFMLISAVDFILKQVRELEYGYHLNGSHADLMHSYALFMTQPLTLGMFIPCDENGVILKKPHFMDFYLGNEYEPHEEEYKICKNYEKAKERVLFEGFLIRDVDIEANGVVDKTIRYVGENALLFNSRTSAWIHGDGMVDIEDLTNLKNKPTLTESALKQIGL